MRLFLKDKDLNNTQPESLRFGLDLLRYIESTEGGPR